MLGSKPASIVYALARFRMLLVLGICFADMSLPPFSLERAVAGWNEAQELLGLPRTAHGNSSLVAHFYGMHRGTAHYKHCGKDVHFIMQAKVASETISHNIKRWASNASCTSLPSNVTLNCSFMFVRNPLNTFVSGFIEMEWRFRQGVQLFGVADMDHWHFHKLTVGSWARSLAFITDLLEFKWETIPKALNHRGAAHHIYPMFGQSTHSQHLYGLDLVGRIEQFDMDLEKVTELCGMGTVRFDHSLGTHVTSKDTMHVKSAMSNVTRECSVRRALCRPLSPDYETFGYLCLPQLCR